MHFCATVDAQHRSPAHFVLLRDENRPQPPPSLFSPQAFGGKATKQIFSTMTMINKEGWEIKKLGEVCEIYQPRTLSSDKLSKEGNYPVYGANGVIGFFSEYNHEEPEVLLTCRGATCGTINVSQPFSWINGNAMVIHRKSEELSFDFLRYLMLSLDYSFIITGAAQPQITRQKLAPTLISFPKIEIQQRIVDELDEINAIISAKKQQLSKLDELAQSIFYNMFGDPVANEKGWEVKKLGEVAEVQNGFAFKSDLFTESGLPILRISNIQNNAITEEGCVFFEESSYNTDLSRYVVEPNRILIAMSGATTGKCGINKTTTCFYLNQRVGMFKENKEMIETMYLFHFLSMKSEESLKLAIGVAQPNLSTSQIKDFPIPLPPLPLQEAFAARVAAIEEEKSSIAASIEKMQTLLDARMQEYFG